MSAITLNARSPNNIYNKNSHNAVPFTSKSAPVISTEKQPERQTKDAQQAAQLYLENIRGISFKSTAIQAGQTSATDLLAPAKELAKKAVNELTGKVNAISAKLEERFKQLEALTNQLAVTPPNHYKTFDELIKQISAILGDTKDGGLNDKFRELADKLATIPPFKKSAAAILLTLAVNRLGAEAPTLMTTGTNSIETDVIKEMKEINKKYSGEIYELRKNGIDSSRLMDVIADMMKQTCEAVNPLLTKFNGFVTRLVQEQCIPLVNRIVRLTNPS